MPSNLLNADTSFPQFSRETSDSEKIEKITSYLFMLLEQLRYTLSNLDRDNFNETGLEEIGKVIAQPIYIRLEGAEGGIHQLSITAELLSSRIEDAEGNVSELTQTAKALTSKIESVEGDVSTFQQTAKSLTSKIEDAEGNISSLQQTAAGLSSTIADVNGNVSALQQTAAGLSSTIQDAEGNISSLQQTVNGLTFTDNSGTTRITGSAIDTSTMRVSSLYGQYVSLNNEWGMAMGCLTITGAETAFAAVDLTSYGALRLTANYGAAYMEAAQYGTEVEAYDRVYTRGAVVTRNGSSLGDSTWKWSDVYASNATIQTSDLTAKKDVEYGLARYDALFDRLRPMSFRFIDGESGRRHLGLGAQDVEGTMVDCGVSDMEFAGFIKSPRQEGAGFDYGLRYGEFIPLCIEQIQRLKGRVDELERTMGRGRATEWSL